MDRTREFVDRLVAWSPVLLLGALAALTYWLDAQVQAPAARRDGSARHDPDLFLHDFKAITFDANGKPRETLSAALARHYPDDESAELDTPTLSLSEPDRPAMTITAERGRIDGDRAHGEFSGNVVVTRDADSTPSKDGPNGPVSRDEGTAREHRSGGDERGAAWNNPRPGTRIRQQGKGRAHPLARQRHVPTPRSRQMTDRFTVARRIGVLVACALAAAASPLADAEKSDREKPINFSAEQPAEVDFEKRVGTLRGNVVITQGTMTIHADRIDFKQNPDNSLSATAVGNPVSFRQKKDDSDEYYEGYAQRAVYDGQKQLLELFDRALLKQGSDEIRSNYVSYNSATGIFKAEGRPDAPGVEGPGDRVRGTFQPRAETPLAPKGAARPEAGTTPPASNASAPAKDAKSARDAKAAAPAKAGPPLKLTPDTSLPASGSKPDPS